VHIAKSAAWLRTLLHELGLVDNEPVNERSKHIEVRYRWIRDAVRKDFNSHIRLTASLGLS
ncbi:hypothetical protein BDM02DRAFT_3273680, partial [Thelephora ganbajun]